MKFLSFQKLNCNTHSCVHRTDTNTFDQFFLYMVGLIPNSVIRKHFKPILPDLMHAHMHNELTRFNVEERIVSLFKISALYMLKLPQYHD